MKKGFAFTVLILISLFVSSCLNRRNKKGQQIGRWIVYYDSAKTLKSMKGRFKNGNAVGKALYYDLGGKLDRKEITRFKKIKTTLYHPNGNKKMVGYARMDNLLDRYHFYFYGRWKYYDEQGRLFKYCYYNKGVMGKTEYLDKNIKTNDSLISALNLLDKKFFEKNATLIHKISNSTINPAISEKYRQGLYEQDSASFIVVGNYLLQNGYPSIKVAGESATIPFSIISYGPLWVKEKYLEIFRLAFKNGDLNGKAFAFYVDKLMVAKHATQIYGTQYYLDSTFKAIDYPVEDPENLEKRRAEVGLGETD